MESQTPSATLEDAIAWGQFDAAMNVTPDSVHYPTTMKLLAAKKHVLCEKPLAENFALADEMATAADKAGLINMVNLSYRNVAAIQEARSPHRVRRNWRGPPCRGTYRQSWLVGNHWGDWRTEPKWLWRLSEKHGSKGVLGDVGIHILDFTALRHRHDARVGSGPPQDLSQGAGRPDRRISARRQ